MRPALLFLLVASSSLVYAQQYICSSPATWTGDFAYTDRADGYLAIGNMSYDAPNQRLRAIEYVDVVHQNITILYELIQLHKENTSYGITTPSSGKPTCQKQPLNTPFNPLGVPVGFSYLGTYCIGLVLQDGQCQGLLVENWQGTEKDPDGVHTYVGTFVRDGQPSAVCLPVAWQDSFANSTSGTTKITQISFFNVTKGVDPSVFIPPKECN